ncbi:MAG: hypothetical protein AAF664_21520, partial [Planctomycetota bacterium]
MRTRRKRTRTLETLEKRNLLFAPVDQPVLLEGLGSLAETLDRVEQHAEFAQAIPGLGQAAGHFTNLSGAVREGLIEPLTGLFDGSVEVDPSEVETLLSDFSSTAEDVVTTVTNVSGQRLNSTTSGSIEVTAKIQQEQTTSHELDSFGDADWIQWNSAADVEVTALTEATITFGIDLVSDQFIVEIGEVSNTLKVDASPVDADLNVGPVATSVDDGIFQLDATLVSDFGTSRLSSSELLGMSLDELASTSAEGSLTAVLPVEYSLGTFNGSETLTWQDDTLFDPAIELPQLSDTGDLVNFLRIDQEDLRGFFRQIGTKLEELLGEDLPVLGDDFLPWVDGLKLPELTDIANDITEFVDGFLSDEDGRASFDTLDELRSRLEAWTGRDTILGYLPSAKTLTYDFEIASSINSSSIPMGVDRDFGALAEIDVDGTVSAGGEFVLAGTFGVDLHELTEDTTPDDITDDDSWSDHFFLDDLSLDANIDASTDAASALARLGFVELEIDEVEWQANASASLEFADDSSTDGRITFKRLS